MINKPKDRYRKCKVCQSKFKVDPFKPFLPGCSFDCNVAYSKILLDNKKAKEKKEENKKWKKVKVDTHSKEYRKAFQDEVNKLARMIDEYFGYTNCIDCGKNLFGYQIDACHLHSRGKNCSLSWNLHILHSGHNHCNFYNEKHESNYKKGLEQRYGKEYLEMVENLPIQYKSIHISNLEVFEKLKLVRGLIRNFNTYKFDNAIQARNSFNTIIGIYK